MKIKNLQSAVIASLFVALFSTQVFAQDDPPFKGGDYWEVTAVELVPGQRMNYARHLADRWRKSMEFSKSQGWIKDYMVLSNIHARSGEADLWLVSVMESWEVDEAEGEKRRKAWRKFSDETAAEMEAAYGDRASMRRIMGETFMREMEFRD